MTATTESKIVSSLDAQLVSCTPLCREHVSIALTLPSFPDSEPGQFLQILCRDPDVNDAQLRDWPADGFSSALNANWSNQQPYLRRPFSIADRWTPSDGSVRLTVISRTVGAGTRWLAALQPGNLLNLTGPLGRGFRLPPPGLPVVLVGGGVGIPPLLYLARRLNERGWQDVTAIFAVTTADLLPLRLVAAPAGDGTPRRCVALAGDAPYPTLVTTDDGSVGLRGLATDGLRAWHARRDAASQPALVCACGPDAMLKAVAGLTRELGLPCQLCIERNMGCGVGTCLSCVVRQRDDRRPDGWSWALACTAGPVFERDELLDY